MNHIIIGRSTFSFVCFLALVTLHGIHAVEYVVTNRATTTPGGIRFNNELGSEYTKQRMAAASDFIWGIFQQNTEAERINRPQVHVNDSYINNIRGDIKSDFNGVLYHEMTHIWQNGIGKVPGEVIEGGGDKWNHGYDVTARFFDYCDSLRNGFVAELNKKMKDSYSDRFFVDLLGKTVEQLWSDYKAKYAN
ncbi:hypothetical protein Pint_33835 [Pistacia integerrima]|uniref:Uncharacterized protein n=1 Tax=Pistacia integerrima TaxID=434235 RepID=A0ACC0X801_9ROSI|nr:hypothetical protein Pint_33835 [Pistacia integerrima]